ncbi:hypothetical protein ART_0331 [Arthrobacter sp. PAMC 25486]|uniref:CsbD family protein n=1 Tax=Arthrobacter sp. PAMC 25486 TaxID=1494608 RepID=UPI000535B973|nr:CsbD family protein [Arthrobacter sp. PAMC 25486]AIX99929.1 hypothetical protein ART_0331 [Arthrobacter sp. PAMC 25486]
MGVADKFDAAKDKVTGKIKETVGKATDDKSQVLEGKLDQAKGTAKDRLADARVPLTEDTTEIHTDDTEGGASTTGGA